MKSAFQHHTRYDCWTDVVCWRGVDKYIGKKRLHLHLTTLYVTTIIVCSSTGTLTLTATTPPHHHRGHHGAITTTDQVAVAIVAAVARCTVTTRHPTAVTAEVYNVSTIATVVGASTTVMNSTHHRGERWTRTTAVAVMLGGVAAVITTVAAGITDHHR